MVKLSLLLAALFATSACAFMPAVVQRSNVGAPFVSSTAVKVSTVDDIGNNIAVRDLLTNMEESGLLTQVAESGLLSKAQDAGVSLSKLEPLLALASENPDILVLVEAAGPDVLPLLPTIVDLAPGALPLLGALIQINPSLLQTAALASVAAAAGVVVVVPDDSTLNIALQTLVVGLLGVGVPVASVIGSTILSKLTK